MVVFGDDKGKFLSAWIEIVVHQISPKMAGSIDMQIKIETECLLVLFRKKVEDVNMLYIKRYVEE